jgi:very-short-patch-repair endonuclease
LIVEIDGNQHYTDEGLAYDEERTKVLEQYGLQVLRFTNRDVDCRFDAVCRMIDQTVRDNIKKFDKFPGI